MPRQSPVSRSAGRSALDSRFNSAASSGAGVAPNAHPEFDKPTTLDNVVSAAKSFWTRIHGTGTKPTPKAAPAPKPADDVPMLSDDAKKYFKP